MSKTLNTSKKLEKKRDYIAYDFASKSPEPCFVNPKAIHDKTTNRTLKEEELEIHFLASHLEYLNSHAWRLLADLAWKSCYKKNYEKISRVKPDHNMFGKIWYAVRYVGSYGLKAQPIFLIVEEQQDIMQMGNNLPVIIPGRRYVVPAILNDSCPTCGSMNCRFKIKPESKNIRCGVCMSLPGLKKGL